MGTSQSSKVLAPWTNSQSEQHQTYFDLYINRFGWGDQRNYIYIQRTVIYCGVKDYVLAKYDDFVQKSILAKTAQLHNQDAANVSMPDFIHDHYVDYLMAQIRSAMDQLSYPDVTYIQDQINLKKNSEDGIRYWLLLGAINGKLCVDSNAKHYVRFSFQIAVYSSLMENGIPNNKNAFDQIVEEGRGRKTAPISIDDRIKYLQKKEKQINEQKKKQQHQELEEKVLDAVIQESLADIKKKDDIAAVGYDIHVKDEVAEVEQKENELKTNDKYKKCPNIDCGIFIERIHGCKHMKCPHCQAEFCDCCGKQVDPKNWKNHYLPPNKCRLWDDIDDLLEDNDVNNNNGNGVNLEELEEGNIYLDATAEKKTQVSEESLDKNIIKQLIDIGIGNRDEIVFAMQNVADNNNIELIANYLLFRNQSNQTTAPIPFTGNDDQTLLWQCHQCYNKNKAIYLFCPLCGMQKNTKTNENSNIIKSEQK